MKIVIVGEFDSDNVGDQLIGEGQHQLFSPLCRQLEVVSLDGQRGLRRVARRSSGRLRLLRLLHRKLYACSAMYRHVVESLAHLMKWHPFKLQAQLILQDADGLVVGGGQLLSDGTLRMLFRLDHLTRAARRKGIPVVAFGTGVSRGQTVISRFLLRRVLSRLSGTSWLRDNASMAAARAAFPEVVLSKEPTPDCAVAGIVASEPLSAQQKRVGIAPMSPHILSRSGHSTTKVDDWWMAIIQSLIRYGRIPVLFCTGVSSDMQYATTLREKLADIGVNIELLPMPRRPEDLLGDLRRMGRVLAQRLHASISYYSLGGVPASASWDSKISEFYGRIALSGRVFRIGLDSPEAVAEALLRPDRVGVDRLVLASMSKADAKACAAELEALVVSRNGAR